MYLVFIYEELEGFNCCIGQFDTKEEAERYADEARKAPRQFDYYAPQIDVYYYNGKELLQA